MEMAILKDECANPLIDYDVHDPQPARSASRSSSTSTCAMTRLVSVVHGQGDSGSLEVVHVHDHLVTAVRGGVGELEFPRSGSDKVGGFVLYKGRLIRKL